MVIQTEFNHPDKFFSQLAKGIAGKQHRSLNIQSIILPSSVGQGMIHVISKSPEFFFTVINVVLKEEFCYQSSDSVSQSSCADFVYEDYESQSSYLQKEEYFSVERAPGKWLHLTMALPKNLLPESKSTQDLESAYQRFSSNPYIKNTLKSLFDIKTINHSASLSMEAKVLDIASLWLKYLQEEIQQADKVFLTGFQKTCIQDAKQLIDQQFDATLTIKELSRKVGINASTLKNGFRQLFNTTIRQYGIQLRIEKACQLLKETEMPISQICLLVGYNNQGHFADIFKRHCGVSPLAYRQGFKIIGY